MKFTKMHGIGNDYIYVDCFKEKIEDPNRVSEIISDRHFGIGGDGLIMICPSECADFKMRMFNADGSEGKMCGNATRCVGKYVYDHGLTNDLTVRLETLSGIKVIDMELGEDGKVATATVDMGKPILNPAKVPVDIDTDDNKLVDHPITADGKHYHFTAVSMGNPHAVIFVDDPMVLDLHNLGPHFEKHHYFPEQVNTEFVRVDDRQNVTMRVWERGSGETLACGTGACAVVVACVLNGFTDRKVTVHLIGGDLEIEWNEQNNHVMMTGPATEVFTGEIDL